MEKELGPPVATGRRGMKEITLLVIQLRFSLIILLPLEPHNSVAKPNPLIKQDPVLMYVGATLW